MRDAHAVERVAVYRGHSAGLLTVEAGYRQYLEAFLVKDRSQLGGSVEISQRPLDGDFPGAGCANVRAVVFVGDGARASWPSCASSAIYQSSVEVSSSRRLMPRPRSRLAPRRACDRNPARCASFWQADPAYALFRCASCGSRSRWGVPTFAATTRSRLRASSDNPCVASCILSCVVPRTAELHPG